MRRAAPFLFALLFLLPSYAFADGGGPVLLIVNGLYFLYGCIAILLSEWLVYRYKGTLTWKDAFWDVLWVNVSSTLVIGLGFPLLIAALSGLGSLLPGELGTVVFALGTWVVGDNSPHPELVMPMTGLWLGVTFLLTVYFETWVVKKRWTKRGFEAPVKPLTLNWFANGVSYSGLVVLLMLGLAGKLG